MLFFSQDVEKEGRKLLFRSESGVAIASALQGYHRKSSYTYRCQISSDINGHLRGIIKHLRCKISSDIKRPQWAHRSALQYPGCRKKKGRNILFSVASGFALATARQGYHRKSSYSYRSQISSDINLYLRGIIGPQKCSFLAGMLRKKGREISVSVASGFILATTLCGYHRKSSYCSWSKISSDLNRCLRGKKGP